MNTKRILSVIFVLVMVLSVCVITADAVQAYEYTDKNGVTFYYALYDDNGTTKAVVGNCRYRDKKEAFTLVFPSKLGGYPVAAIADEALAEHILFNAVKLPDTLEYIGDSAFRNTEITTVHIPKNVSIISVGAFSDMESFTVASENKYYKAVDGVLYTKDGKFLVEYPSASKTKSFKVPDGVEYIYEKAFMSAENLKKVTLPKSVVAIDDYAFSGSGLETFHISSNITYIGEEAFSYTDNLKKVTIDKGFYPYIGADAFNSSGLEYDENGAIYIGHLLYHVYNPYMNTKEVVIKEGTTGICTNAEFFVSEKLLKLPSTLEYIPVEVFHNIDIGAFSVHKDNPYYTDIDGALYTKDKKTLLVFPTKEVETYTLADTTEGIYTGAFWRRMEIEHLIVPESLNVLYDKAFQGADFTKLTFLGDAQLVGYKPMADWCYYLEELNLPEGSVMFGREDFENTQWYMNQKNGFVSVDNVLLGYKGSITLKTLRIRDGFTSIGRKAFINRYTIEELILPENLKAVGEFAFANCANLKEVYVPASVDEIRRGAFGYSVSIDSDTGAVTELKKTEGFVIKGFTNSLAESYADANGFEFVSVGYLEPESTLLGDVDCDGRLTVKDATLVQKYVAGMIGINTQDKINADFNCDGKINVRDATAIQKKLAHLI